MTQLPIEIIDKIMLYNRTKEAECIKELLSRFKKNPKWHNDKKLYSDIKIGNAFLIEERANNEPFHERWTFNPYPDRKCFDGYNYEIDRVLSKNRLFHPLDCRWVCGTTEAYKWTSSFYVK